MFKNLKSLSIPEVLLLLVLLTLPLAEHWNSKALLLSMLFACYGFYKKNKIEFPKFGWLFILIFISSAISYLWSENKTNTFNGIVSLLPLLLFTLAYQQLIGVNNPFRILKITSIFYIFYGLVMIFLAFIRYLATNDYETFYYHALTEPFQANAIYIALIFGLVFIFQVYHLLFEPTKNSKLDYLIVLGLFSLQLLLSSKLILSVLIIILILFAIKYILNKGVGRRKIILGFAISFSLIFIVGLSSFTKKRFKEIADLKQIENVFELDYFGRGYLWNGLTLRLFQLRCFYEIEKDNDFNSLLGTGFKASQPELNKKYAQYDLYRGPSGEGENDGYFVYNFHNQYAQFIIELGVFGFVIIAFMFYFLLIIPIKNKNILILGIGLIFISFALSETYMHRQKGIVSFVVFSLLANYLSNNKLINT
jgi:O-antigen ligase